MRILITGAGSVMGQSIYKALSMYDFQENLEIFFANSDPIGAGVYFSENTRTTIVATPIFPLAKSENYINHVKDYADQHRISIIFPGTQHELDKVSQLRDYGINVATLPQKIARLCMDKLKTCKVLSKHGIKVPTTLSLENYLSMENSIKGSVIVKPNTNSSSRGLLRFDSYTAAFFGTKDKIEKGLIVQNILMGDEFTCGCYIDRYSKKIHIITIARTLTPDGATLYGRVINNPKVTQYVCDVAKSLIEEGLDFGHINVQLIVSDIGDPCLFEINGRLSSTEAPKARLGFNSCAAFVTNLVREREFTDWHIRKDGSFIRYYEEIYI